MANIITLTHPSHDAKIEQWKKYRLVFEGGRSFIDEYLSKYSTSENANDFTLRKEKAYAPAHAKAAIIDIKNSIFQRLVDVVRRGGPRSYTEAIAGKFGGVDRTGNNMTGFMGREVLPELLPIGKVGIFVDKNTWLEKPTLGEANSIRPYIYIYRAEDIINWRYVDGVLVSVLLRTSEDVYDDDYGLTEESQEIYRLFTLDDSGVTMRVFDSEGNEVSGRKVTSNIPEIPLVILELSHSLLTDVADHQIALLNLGSSDITIAQKSLFPLYTEQYNPASEFAQQRLAESRGSGHGGESDEAQKAKDPKLELGAIKGRRYPTGTDRPDFIAPPTGPLEASMKKQDQLKQEIRQLVNLSITDLEPRRQSAEAKAFDEKSLEAGLSYIGMELEYGERRIAEFWASYEDYRDDVLIVYPQKYSIKGMNERIQEAKDQLEFVSKIPSKEFQRETMIEIVRLLRSGGSSSEKIDVMINEIQSAEQLMIDPETIIELHEEGLITAETGCRLMSMPKDEHTKAEEEHARRLARIKESQSDGARGVGDLDVDPSASAKGEKKISQSKLESDDTKTKTRGDA